MKETAGGLAPEDRIAGFASLVLATAVTILVLSGMQFFMAPQQAVKQSLNPLYGMTDFNPEPVERLQFLTGMILMPVLLLSFHLLFRPLAGRLREDAAARWDRGMELAVIAGLLAILIAGLIASGWSIWGADLNLDGRSRLQAGPVAAAAMIAMFLIASLYRYGRHLALERAGAVAARIATVLSLALIALVALFSVFGIGSIRDPVGIYTGSFNALFHGMVQVYLGRELTVDLSYLYGLFPHLVEPFFTITGLSVLTFSSLMALLNMAAFLLLFLVLRDLTARKLLAGITMIAIICAGYFVARKGSFDPYFQYHPVRFLFPVLSIFLAARYFSRGGRVRYYLMFLTCSVAVLWNADTGLVSLLAWIIALAFRELATRSFGKAAAHVLTGTAVFAATVGLFSLAMRLRYGSFPDYWEFFRAQRLFYIQGFGMMPMTAIHPWNMVILVYAAGLLYAIMHLVNGRLSPKTLSVFHLSVLGTGLFSYFQGRSHDFALAGVSYPAIILAAVFADTILEHPPELARAGRPVLVGVLLFALSFCLVDMTRIAPAFVTVAAHRWKPIFRPEETVITRAAKFIRDHTQPGEEVLIISYLSGVFHLESRTFARRHLESFSESTEPASSRVPLMDETMKTFDKIFVGSEGDLATVKRSMLGRYRLVDSTGYVALFTPR